MTDRWTFERAFMQAQRASKTALVHLLKEEALERGETVIVYSPKGGAKYRRVKRNGRAFDLIENLSVD